MIKNFGGLTDDRWNDDVGYGSKPYFKWRDALCAPPTSTSSGPDDLMMMLMTLRDDDDDAPMTDDVTMFYDVLGLRTIQNRDSEGGKRYAATTPIKDDAEGHLIYKPGDVINGRCTKY